MMHWLSKPQGTATPSWYVFRTTRQKWAANWFEANGIEAWFPTRTVHKTKTKAGRSVRVSEEKPVVSGYVFASFRGVPVWHEIRRRAIGRIIGVVAVDGIPRKFTDAEMLQMQQVPHRLERIRQEQIEAQTIRPGDKVQHPTLGEVRVTGVDGPLARVLAPMLGGDRDIAVDVMALEKIG